MPAPQHPPSATHDSPIAPEGFKFTPFTQQHGQQGNLAGALGRWASSTQDLRHWMCMRPTLLTPEWGQRGGSES